jgi:hypothetical protein
VYGVLKPSRPRAANPKPPPPEAANLSGLLPGIHEAEGLQTGQLEPIPATAPAVASIASTATAATVAATATAATAATEAAATAAAATEAATPTATSAAATLFARTRFVDGQRPAIVLLPIERSHRRRRLFVGPHFYESESLAPAGVPVIDDLGGYDLTMRRKQLLEFRAIRRIAQIPDIQLLTHFGISLDG